MLKSIEIHYKIFNARSASATKRTKVKRRQLKMNILKKAWLSFTSSERDGMKVLIWAVVIILIGIAGDVLISSVTKTKTATAEQDKTYNIEMLVPERVVLIQVKKPIGFPSDYAVELSDGLKEVGKTYKILYLTPINGQIGSGSATTSLIVLVEPKPN